VANSAGRIEIQIRDLDQTVIGNPAHDLIRLGLSLAFAARGSDLPGVTTAKMLEQMMEGYEKSFEPDFHEESDVPRPEIDPPCLQAGCSGVMEDLGGGAYQGYPPQAILADFKRRDARNRRSFENEEMRRLATMLRSRKDDARVKLLDAAYWIKGRSSLGRLRYAILLRVGSNKGKDSDFRIMDI
jgi:uncharacterized protein (DUF2252 family)